MKASDKLVVMKYVRNFDDCCKSDVFYGFRYYILFVGLKCNTMLSKFGGLA